MVFPAVLTEMNDELDKDGVMGIDASNSPCCMHIRRGHELFLNSATPAMRHNFGYHNFHLYFEFVTF